MTTPDRARVQRPPHASADDGFATPAAMVISFAIALTAASVATVSIMALRTAQTDNQRLRAEFALEGDRARAALGLMSRADETAVRWSTNGPDGATEVVAEPEAQKLSVRSGAALADAQLQTLGAANLARVRAALETLAAQSAPSVDLIQSAGDSQRWRLCARSAISPYGEAERLAPPQAARLAPGTARLGELWRLRLARADGWIDDSVVRFTGSRLHPMSVAAHWFGRGRPMGQMCTSLAIGASD